MHDARPFLSVLAWPEGYGRELVAQLLADTSGVDYETLKLRLGQAPPTVIGQVDPVAASRALFALIEEGGDGFAPTFTDLAALGPTLKIRDLRIEDGEIHLDLWRAESVVVAREEVEILVRAHLRGSVKERMIRPVPGPSGTTLDQARRARAELAWGIGGAMGLAIDFTGGYIDNAGQAFEKRVKTSDKLDIHSRGGRVFQIDGDKFGFRALGDLRGQGDRTNMDRMCELLSLIAPDEIVDPYFPLFSPPPGHDRLRLPGMILNHEDPAFAFYSRWAALMYRYLKRGW